MFLINVLLLSNPYHAFLNEIHHFYCTMFTCKDAITRDEKITFCNSSSNLTEELAKKCERWSQPPTTHSPSAPQMETASPPPAESPPPIVEAASPPPAEAVEAASPPPVEAVEAVEAASPPPVETVEAVEAASPPPAEAVEAASPPPVEAASPPSAEAVEAAKTPVLPVDDVVPLPDGTISSTSGDARTDAATKNTVVNATVSAER